LPSLSPEKRLVLTTLQTVLDKPLLVDCLDTTALDWARVREVATNWDVLRIFVTHLGSAGAETMVPQDILVEFKRESKQIAARNWFLIQEFLAIKTTLQELGIQPFVFKGPALGIQAYDHALARRFSDIDLVIRQDQVVAVIELMTQLGFQSTFRFTPNAKRHWAQSGRDFGFFRDGLALDFHQRFVEGPRFLGLTAEDWLVSNDVQLESDTIRVFTPEMTVLALCIHGIRHTWTPLKFLADLAHFVHSQGQIDWNLLRHRASRMGCLQIVAIGLHLANRVCGLQLPEAAQVVMVLTKRGRRLLNGYQRRATEIDPTIDAVILFHGVYDALDTLGYRLRYLAYFFLTPSLNDFDLVALPRPLHGLYVVIRPLRLAWRFIAAPLMRIFRSRVRSSRGPDRDER